MNAHISKLITLIGFISLSLNEISLLVYAQIPLSQVQQQVQSIGLMNPVASLPVVNPFGAITSVIGPPPQRTLGADEGKYDN